MIDYLGIFLLDDDISINCYVRLKIFKSFFVISIFIFIQVVMDIDFIIFFGFEVFCFWFFFLLFVVNFNLYGMVLILDKFIFKDIK